MSKGGLSGSGIRGGVWHGVLESAAGSAPQLELVQEGGGETSPVTLAVMVAPGAAATGRWAVSAPIPVAAIREGVQTFVIAEKGAGTALAAFTIIAGEPLAEDIRAEIDLLRAELELMKTALRRLGAAAEV